MARLYNDHLTGEAREVAIQEAYFDNLFNKYNAMYEMVCIQEKQMINDAEYKVFSESGTYDDYSYFLEEVAAETGEQKKGILVKMAEAISSIFTSIINAIKGFFSKNQEAEIEVDEGEYKALDNLKSGWGKVQSALQKASSGDIAGALAELPTAVKVLPIVGAGAVATGVIVKKNSKEIEGKLNDVSTMIKTSVENAVNAVTAKFGEDSLATKFINGAKSIASKIMSFVTGFTGKIGKKVAEVKNAVTKSDDNTQDNASASNKEQKNVEYQKQAAQNGVQIIPNGKSEYRVDKSTGKVTLFDKKTKTETDVDVTAGGVPVSVINAVKKAKGRSAVAQQNAQNSNTGKSNGIDKNNKQITTVGTNIGPNKVTVKLDEKSGTMYTVDKNGGHAQKIDINGLFRLTGGRGNYRKIKAAYDAAMANVQANESEGSVIDFVTTFFEAGIDIYREDENTISFEVECDKNYVESTSQSIFGYDLDNERLMQESENFDKELAELSAMFESL